jgi:hypothetical protein
MAIIPPAYSEDMQAMLGNIGLACTAHCAPCGGLDLQF